MEVLVSTNEAANILGLSVQGIHYRIKTKKLRSIKKDGKTFVYVDQQEIKPRTLEQESTTQFDTNKEIIKTKDEQISLLKKTLKWINKQHIKEISRLERNHDKVIDTFKSEINLLQKAYNELQKLYKSQNTKQITYDKPYLSLEEFILLMKQKGKNIKDIKRLILLRVQLNDSRFYYDSALNILQIKNADFNDL